MEGCPSRTVELALPESHDATEAGGFPQRFFMYACPVFVYFAAFDAPIMTVLPFC
jgi:hypothetical protein